MSRDRYLLDGRPLIGVSATRGIGTYTRALLDALVDLGHVNRLSLLLPRGAAVPESVGARGIPVAGRLPVVKRRLQPITDSLAMAPLLWRIRPRLFHALEWAQPLLPTRTPVVITVHDLIPFLFTDRDYTWMRRERWLALRQLRRADAVIAVSQQTADDSVRLAGVDPARVHVVPHGVAPGFTPAGDEQVATTRARFGLRGDYVLAVGTFDSRKRAPLLMDVLRRLSADSDVRLAICGDQGVFADRVRAAADHAGVADRVVMTGYVNLDDLRALYSGAACLLFTSAYEGFGLPVLEAMACGCAVVACRNSAVTAVAGTAGILVDDADAAAMADAVVAIMAGPDERERRIAAGIAWAANFTWRRCAEQTLAVYRGVES